MIKRSLLSVALLLSGCAVQDWIYWLGSPRVQGVQYKAKREPSEGEIAALGRVVEALPHAPWSNTKIYLVPVRYDKFHGWSTHAPQGYRISLDPRDPACVLVHEMVEHVWPHSRGEGWNADHLRKDLTERARAAMERSNCKVEPL